MISSSAARVRPLKLPELGRSLVRAAAEFSAASNELATPSRRNPREVAARGDPENHHGVDAPVGPARRCCGRPRRSDYTPRASVDTTPPACTRTSLRRPAFPWPVPSRERVALDDGDHDPDEESSGADQMSFLSNSTSSGSGLLSRCPRSRSVSSSAGLLETARLIFTPLARPSRRQVPDFEPLRSLHAAHEAGVAGRLFPALPVILWQIWLLFAPGLYSNEKRFRHPFRVPSTVFFHARRLRSRTTRVPVYDAVSPASSGLNFSRPSAGVRHVREDELEGLSSRGPRLSTSCPHRPRPAASFSASSIRRARDLRRRRDSHALHLICRGSMAGPLIGLHHQHRDRLLFAKEKPLIMTHTLHWRPHGRVGLIH